MGQKIRSQITAQIRKKRTENSVNHERIFLEKIKNNLHNPICQQQSLKLTDCLCFQIELQKILSFKLKKERKKRKRKPHIHWDKFICGTKNRKTTSDLNLVTCGHCRKSNDFLALEKVTC